jgi:heterodisulfide reductase subunit A
MEKSALVIGGGITGIQAALDLASANVLVVMLESSPSIGGRMAQLDKTFPTNDCSMCILSPKLVEANRHPNITIYTNSDLEEVKGKKGDFKVKVKRRARFIDESKCIGCGICAEKCPNKVPNEFDCEIGERKAIYIPFPQAVPLKYTIDKDNCIYFKNGKCKACLKFCPNDAPVFDQQDEILSLDIGSIIVATGFDSYEPNDRPEYKYGTYPDVVTALEFERMLSPSGPTAGEVIRRSDGKTAKSIVFIQCVGSRNNNNGVPYCSRVCCMHSVKEALIAKEHSAELEDTTILYTDIRAFGKNFDHYYHRAKFEEGVAFLRGYSTDISEDQTTGRLIVHSEDTLSGELTDTPADLVVLATALLPGAGNKNLSEILNIDLDDYGFFKAANSPRSLVESSVDGIYLSGCATGPRDIPDSVSTSSAAASRALEDMSQFSPPHREAEVAIPMGRNDEEPRIGIFVCHCGTNIGGVVDVPSVAEYAKTLPNVVYAEDNLFTCSDATQQQISDMIKEHHLNRVIVASCTPRTHEPLFQETVMEAGLNPYLFEMANIREHCSWVHKNEQEEATEKSKELIKMAVAKSARLKEVDRQTFDLKHTAAVIGGGITGMQAAIRLARCGIETHLLEKEAELGGRIRELNKLSISDADPKALLEGLISEISSLRSNLIIHTGSELSSVKGSIGNFELEYKNNGNTENLMVGAVIIATGSDPYDPEGDFGYGKFDNVVTNLELENNLKINKKPSFEFGKPKKAVYILCVGSRTLPEGKNEIIAKNSSKPSNPGCSRICCDVGIQQSLELQKSGIETTVLYRDIRTFDAGAEEQYYDASKNGIQFIRYEPEAPPEVIKDGKSVKVRDSLTQEELEIDADLIILGCGTIPKAGSVQQLQSLFKIPKGTDGFFLEAHPKLAPLETTTGGIYLCGTAQYPKGVHESLTQGEGAALKAAVLLSQEALSTEPMIAIVDNTICWGCGTCVDVCVYGAPQLTTTESGGKVSYINPALCKGCGTCAARCPSGAISANLFTDNQLIAMICALQEES